MREGYYSAYGSFTNLTLHMLHFKMLESGLIPDVNGPTNSYLYFSDIVTCYFVVSVIVRNVETTGDILQ